MPGPRAAAALALWIVAAPAAGAPAAPAAAPGDPGRGEALFTGAARFENGGAPCLACHGVAGHGLARAASFGPDLTGAFASLGGDGLDGVLTEVPFPSMTPIYAKHAITPAERADVAAFLEGAGQGAPPALGARFALGVAGIATLFLVASVVLGRGGRTPPARREAP